jgi:hypothetical protein
MVSMREQHVGVRDGIGGRRATVVLAVAVWAAALMSGTGRTDGRGDAAPEPVSAPVGTVDAACGPCRVGPEGQDGLDAYAGMVPDRHVTALGAASCATVSCHGGPLAGNHAVQSFAATIWAGHDPHAVAYEVLHNERSQRMARLLGIGPPQRARQCLVCHSVQDMALEPLPREVLADGVSCAACHGDATHWQQVHTLQAWKTLPSESRAMLGYRDLTTPQARVATCVRCHVGDAGHEVNHDLIAAGHPRLFFEFAAYQRLEPRHWSPRGRAESAADFTARSWSAGQAATLAAAADLLAVRVQRTQAAVAAGRPQRWPEFAEFDCYSCHRTLGPDTQAAARTPAARQPRPGQPAWQPWQVAGGRLLRAGLEGAVSPAGTPAGDLERSVVDIRRLLDTDWAAADAERLDRVLLEARGLAHASRRAATAIDARPLIDIDASNATLDSLVAANPADWQTWDAAVQTALALEAGRAGGPAEMGVWRPVSQRRVATSAEPRRSLDELRATLQFAPGADSPGPFDARGFQRQRRQVP